MRNKIFIFLAYRNSTHQFIELVKYLNKKYKVSCLVFGYENYIKVKKNKILFEEIFSYEKLVNSFYKNVRLIDNKELIYIEKEIGSLWNVIYADRQLLDTYYDQNYGKKKFKYKELKSFVYQWYNFFDQLFKNKNFKYLINYATASLPAYLSTKIGKKYETKYLLIKTLAIPDRLSILDDVEGEYLILPDKKLDKDIEWASNFVKNFDKSDPPHWIKKKDKEFFIKRNINTLRNIFLEKKTFKFIDNNYTAYLNHSIKNIIFEKYKKIYWEYIANLYSKSLKEIDEKYLYFSFHQEPEANLMVHNLELTNQLNVLENLSKNCPIDLKIVAKCHPNQIPKPPSFYKKINSLPNVIFINKDVDSRHLMKNAQAIFCISGTLIMEALLMNKKVLVYGNSPIVKNFFPNLRCDFKNLKKKLMDENKPDIKEIIEMVAYFKNISIDIDRNDFLNNNSSIVSNKLIDLFKRLDEQYN